MVSTSDHGTSGDYSAAAMARPNKSGAREGGRPDRRPERPEREGASDAELVYGLRAALAVFAVRPDDILRAGFSSEVLVLGAMPSATEVVLLATDQPVPNGTRIG